MSEEISYSNYLYQGQVYSPAFSDPPSPSSPMSTSSDTATSSSIQSENHSSEDQSSVISNMSPVHTDSSSCSDFQNAASNKAYSSSQSSDKSMMRYSESRNDNQTNSNSHTFYNSSQNSFSNFQGNSSKPKFPTKYHEMLQPLSPVTTIPVEEEVIKRPLPNKTHVTEHDIQLQKQFHSLVDSATCPLPKTTERTTRNSTTANEKSLTNRVLQNLEDFLVHHSQNIDVNQYNNDGQTALQQCCLAGNLPLVKLLVRFGANMRLTTREGFSVLHIAAFSGHSDLLAFVMGQSSER